MSDWSWMKAQDALSGKEGTLYAKFKSVDGKEKVYPIAECKSITAKATKNKTEFKSLGQNATQHKVVGWTGTGTLTVHYASTQYAWIMSNYVNGVTVGGKKVKVDMDFTLTVTNEDTTSSLGKQTIVLKGVNLDEAEIAKLDVDAEFLDQTMNFTFTGFEILDSFKGINGLNVETL